MWDWVDQGAALWGFLALPLAVLLAVPGIVELYVTARDWSRSTSDLHASLRETKGRVRGDGLQSRAIGSHNSFEAIVQIDDQPRASDDVYRRLAEGASVVLVGEAGAGKSEMLEELHRLSYRAPEGPADPLIEVVSLASLVPRDRHADVRAGAARVIADRYRLSRRAVNQLLAEARIVLAFDGLDEVEAAQRHDVTRQLAEESRRVPILVSTRLVTVGAADGINTGSAPDILEAAGFQRADLQPLRWSSVEWALARRQAPVPLATDPGAAQLQNPLLLQIALFLWRRWERDDSQFADLIRSRQSLLTHFARGADPVGSDKALRFLGVMAADHEKSTEAPFRVFPVQLAGRTFTYTAFVSIVTVALVGFAAELWVVAPTLIIALLSSTPYFNQSSVGRMQNGWTGRASRFGWLVGLAYAFCVVNVVRIASWSAQAGEWTFGDWIDLFSIPTINLVIWLWIFTTVSPMQVKGNGITYTRYMEQHAWPIFVIFAALLPLTAIPGVLSAFLPLLVYVGTTCVYLAISLGVAWHICGTPPWKWRSLTEALQSRGLVTRAGSTVKLVHREIEELILRDLAADASTPRALWASFSADWDSRLIPRGATMDDSQLADVFASTLSSLAIRDAWSPANVTRIYGYYQWLRVDPAAALSILRTHLRLVPFSSLRALLPDALDRTGRDGTSLAHRQLSRRRRDAFSIHWPLSVLDRHEHEGELIRLYRDLERRHAASPRIVDLIARRRLTLLVSDLEPEEEQALLDDIGPLNAMESPDLLAEWAMIVLERTEPDTTLARKLLMEAGGGSLVMARYIQLLLLEKSPVAESAALLAVARLSVRDGYLAALEAMVTALAATESPEVAKWVERAAQSGLRIRGRPGLQRNLGVAMDSVAYGLFSR